MKRKHSDGSSDSVLYTNKVGSKHESSNRVEVERKSVNTAPYEQLGDIYYIIDRQNNIISCGPEREWDTFSAENGGKNLETHNVIGKDLFSYISGERTIEQYKKIHELIWSGKKKRFVIKSMCDSPVFRRPLRTCISAITVPSPGKSLDSPSNEVSFLLYHHCIWDEQARPPVHHLNCPHYGNSNNDNIPILLMCSYCKDVMYPAGSTEGKWITSAEYYARSLKENKNDHQQQQPHHQPQQQPQQQQKLQQQQLCQENVLLSHTVCDKCYSLVMADLEESCDDGRH